MLRKILLLLFLTMPLAMFAQEGVKSPLASSRQLLLVVTKSWSVAEGTLQQFESKNKTWQPVGAPVRVVVGRKGLGWGRGLHAEQTNSTPQKKEGDGKSPAGIFRLSSAFGYATSAEMKLLKLPYAQCTTTLECVDDVNSIRYNSIADARAIERPDWKSSEQMLMKDDEYRLGIFVDHNVAPPAPGGGSCIFLHIWKGAGIGTSGCTAMASSDMEKIIHWLDPAANPILIQLPETEYLRLQNDWQLPIIPAKNSPPSGERK